MPQIMVDLPFEKIVDTVKKLSEEEQEKLLFAINSDYAKARGQNEEYMYCREEEKQRVLRCMKRFLESVLAKR